MSTKKLAENLGRIAEWSDGSGIKYEVRIEDSRTRWGNVDYLITPVSGSGVRWVSESSVRFVEEWYK